MDHKGTTKIGLRSGTAGEGAVRLQRTKEENLTTGEGDKTFCRHEPEQRKSLIKRGDETFLDIWGGMWIESSIT